MIKTYGIKQKYIILTAQNIACDLACFFVSLSDSLQGRPRVNGREGHVVVDWLPWLDVIVSLGYARARRRRRRITVGYIGLGRSQRQPETTGHVRPEKSHCKIFCTDKSYIH